MACVLGKAVYLIVSYYLIMVYIYSIFVFVSLKGIYTLEIGLFQFVCDEGTPFSFALKPVIVDTKKMKKKIMCRYVTFPS